MEMIIDHYSYPLFWGKNIVLVAGQQKSKIIKAVSTNAQE
jgi:hypothetical protein